MRFRAPTPQLVKLLALVAIIGALPLVLAHPHGGGHGGEEEMDDMDMVHAMVSEEPTPDPSASDATYFAHPDFKGAIYAHIALMVIAWVFVLPIGLSAPAPGKETPVKLT
jgi:hypothetical protein